MRTSTLLAVLAALMLLVACAAPVFGQSSSSSTGESSSSSAATIIASSSSSTGSSNNNTVASSSAASVSSSSSGANGNTITVTVTYPFTLNSTEQARYQQGTLQDIQTVITSASVGSTATITSAVQQAGSYIVQVLVTSPVSTLYLSIQAAQTTFPFLKQASSVTTNQQPIQGGSASTLSCGFAAVAVVLAALLQ